MTATMQNTRAFLPAGGKLFLAGLLVGLLLGALLGYSLLSLTGGYVATPAQSYVEKIKSRGKLILGTSADWPPFEYVDAKGQYAGIDIEIAKRIAAELGVQLEVKDMKFAALIEALKKGDIDIILADMTPTAEREKEVDFSLPYYYSKGYAVVTLKTSAISSGADLLGKRIGVQLGTIQEDWAKKNLEGKATVISYNRVYPEMVMVLKRGDIDAIIIGDTIASALVTKDPDLKIATYVGQPTIGAAVAVPQGAEDLKYVVNRVIERLIETGEISAIFQQETLKWLGEQ
ncbi:MAG: ABC transporter substrate-binding protein [Thermofilum sp.]